MKNTIYPLLTVGIILLSGCNRGSDVSESVPTGVTSEAESERSGDSAETAKVTDLSESPAGVTAPDIVVIDDTPDNIPETDVYGSVSLVRDKFDYLREMTDFSGQYVTMEDFASECVTIPKDIVNEYGFAFSADGSRLYFQKILYNENGFPITDLTVTEYDVLTRETDTLTLSRNADILYIDSEYAVYDDENSLYLLTRESGEVITLPGSDRYSPLNYRSGVKRVGNSFFYNISEEFSNADGSMSFESRVVCRYSARTGYFAKLTADADIIGATSEEVYCKTSGGRIYRIRADGVYGSFDFPYDCLYAVGGQAGYISPVSGESIFGRRYEVGRVLPWSNTSAYDYPFFVTHYGTYPYDIGITSASVAFVGLRGNESRIVLAVDINGNRAADTECSRIVHCGSEWVYLENENDDILALKTI